MTYSVRLLEVLLAAGCDVHSDHQRRRPDRAQAGTRPDVDLENFSPAMLMLDSGDDLRDPKLQLLRSRAGISSDSSNVLGMGTGEPGTLRFYHLAIIWPRRPAARS